jgi:hypothetical protein
VNWGTEAVAIRGILVPVDWDTKGMATKAAILTDDEDEYLICEKGKISELLDFMQQMVEVKGVVTEEAGQKMIHVKSWKQTRWSPKAKNLDKRGAGGF